MLTHENATVRYPSLVRARVPRELIVAVDATARAKFMSHWEYVRQSLLKSLKADGAVLLPHSSLGLGETEDE
jgi:hypothetical protein